MLLSDRQWIAYDFVGTVQNMYEMDHELVSEDIRFASSTNDSPWVTVSGITDPVLLLNTVPNTNPGPVFVNHTNHTVYGIFTSSIRRQTLTGRHSASCRTSGSQLVPAQPELEFHPGHSLTIRSSRASSTRPPLQRHHQAAQPTAPTRQMISPAEMSIPAVMFMPFGR